MNVAITNAYQAPLVEFEWRAEEDRTATIAAGHTQYKQVAYAVVQVPGSRDVFEAEANAWLQQLDFEADVGRVPRDIAQKFREGFNRWADQGTFDGIGTPVASGGVFTPVEQKAAVSLGLHTIELLAECGEDAIAKLGPGGRDMKKRAKKYLDALTSGEAKLAAQIEVQRIENEALKERLNALEEALKAAHRDLNKNPPKLNK